MRARVWQIDGVSGSPVSTLCRACALCCDGTLFTRVPLGPTERVPDVELSVIKTPTGGRYVPQRCSALNGCDCRVYEARPVACRKYECLLAVALKGGELSLPEALEVVAKAKALPPGASEETEAFFTFHFGRRT